MFKNGLRRTLLVCSTLALLGGMSQAATTTASDVSNPDGLVWIWWGK